MPTRRHLVRTAVGLLIICLTGTLLANSQDSAPSLLPGGTLYPRLLRLAHGQSPGKILASTDTVIFQSLDQGRTFQKLGSVPPRPGSRHVCCSTLYELPRAIGSLPAGTLLSAGTYAAGPHPEADPSADPAIDIYASRDGGHTWRYLGTPVAGGPALPTTKPPKQRGLWEPEFEVAADGALVLFVSDETDPCCSQKLIQLRTYDGVHWRDKRDIIAMLGIPEARPGMIVSTPLLRSHFLMSYEICGGQFACDVYTRTSTDGWNFGDPAAPGQRATTAIGQYFCHAPTSTWAPAPQATTLAGSAKQRKLDGGRVLLIGQMLYEADGTLSKQNGTVFFTTDDLSGIAPWTTLPAPVPVPYAYDNYCPNYSSVLLPSQDGSSVLELASRYDAAQRCATFFGSGSLPDKAAEPR